MKKSDAIQILGGSIAAAAEAIGASYQAVSKWPDVLPRRIEDRVIAAIARRKLPPEAFRPELAHPAPAAAAQDAAEQEVGHG